MTKKIRKIRKEWFGHGYFHYTVVYDNGTEKDYFKESDINLPKYIQKFIRNAEEKKVGMFGNITVYRAK